LKEGKQGGLKMRVITSQSYRDYDIIAEKIEQLKGATKITLTVWETEMKNELGQDLYILADGHHTYEAAKELGLNIEFEIEKHPEGLVDEELLEVAWMDGDYRYLDNNDTVW
jgi:uncharacterized protein (DUF1015 family)